MEVGIEALNLYGGSAVIDARTMFRERGLDLDRFENLMMNKKSVALPCEDPVTNGVNAAKPLIDRMSTDEKNRIEWVITSSESGLDFGKSLSTYIHDYLGLNRNCRLIETKQACYAGVASMQMAACFVASGASPGAKALVIATDVARAAARNTYSEPSQATGAAALIVGDRPEILELDFGAAGFFSYEVMDTCRPLPELETGDADLSLLSYLECLEKSFQNYAERVEGADFSDTFDYLAFHTPFAGMVKGAHRTMMRKLKGAPPAEVEADFARRVEPSLAYCTQVGNLYSATLFMALCGLIDRARINGSARAGLFAYGSGCSSEFFSGTLNARSQSALAAMKIAERLAERYELKWDEYERLIDLNEEWLFGARDKEVNLSDFAGLYDRTMGGRGLLRLKRIKDYHREYEWS